MLEEVVRPFYVSNISSPASLPLPVSVSSVSQLFATILHFYTIMVNLSAFPPQGYPLHKPILHTVQRCQLRRSPVELQLLLDGILLPWQFVEFVISLFSI